jgi:hypothetical protein
VFESFPLSVNLTSFPEEDARELLEATTLSSIPTLQERSVAVVEADPFLRIDLGMKGEKNLETATEENPSPEPDES